MSDPIKLPHDLPDPVIEQRRRVSPSLVWLVPAIAVLAGLVLIVRAYTSAGPDITISFSSADGLEKGKTEVRFRNVVIGRVRDIRLSDDHQGVIVSVSLTQDAQNFAVADSRFWVVRPRADLGGISGLTTLLSGPYIGVDAGVSTERTTEFVGLEVPPAITSDQRGKRYTLMSADLGSLSIGSPIYFRRMPVGRITGYQLGANGRSVLLHAFINEPYDRYVTEDSQFWNASGVDVSLDAGGLKLNTQSLVTLLTGGIAFDQRGSGGTAAPAGSQFKLYADEKSALAPADGEAIQVRLRFAQSIRGLTVDAPVDFKGIELGRVTSIGLDFNPARKRFSANVIAELYPDRLGSSYQSFRDSLGRRYQSPEALLGRLVERGMRAQLRSGNLLTGQLYVALDFVPGAAPAQLDLAQQPLEIPTLPGSLDQIQTQIAGIVAKLDKVPIEDIGNNLRDTLQSADSLLRQLDKELAPEAKKTLVEVRETLGAVNGSLDASGGQNLQTTLQEVERAARSMRNLGDYLQRHPEALLRGKPGAEDP